MWYAIACRRPGARSGAADHAGVAQLVEYLPSKQGVAGSSPVSRSKLLKFKVCDPSFLVVNLPARNGLTGLPAW